MAQRSAASAYEPKCCLQVAECRTHDYVRHGVTDLLAALDVATGKVVTATKPRHRAEELKAFLVEINKAAPLALPSTLCSRNSSTHKTPANPHLVGPPPPCPSALHAHELGLVQPGEGWFAELTRKLLRRSIHRTVLSLEKDLRTRAKNWNSDPRPSGWRTPADEILDSRGRCCGAISDSGH
ncbi:MAG TPA: hypothetical protein VEJ84_10060 [Acidimicrobiales bacterium]|nr:hypothetical protein [Acidimicrobiales bacterium]